MPETNRFKTWVEWGCGGALMVFALLIMIAACPGCIAAGEMAAVKARLTGVESQTAIQAETIEKVSNETSLISAKVNAEVEARIGTIESTIGDVTARVATIEADQTQTGLINIASTGGSLGGYLLATALLIVGWMFRRRGMYWKATLSRVVQEIESAGESAAGIKTTMARRMANMTLFGRLVKSLDGCPSPIEGDNGPAPIDRRPQPVDQGGGA